MRTSQIGKGQISSHVNKEINYRDYPKCHVDKIINYLDSIKEYRRFPKGVTEILQKSTERTHKGARDIYLLM